MSEAAQMVEVDVTEPEASAAPPSRVSREDALELHLCVQKLQNIQSQLQMLTLQAGQFSAKA